MGKYLGKIPEILLVEPIIETNSDKGCLIIGLE
jgi:hypothetical protein